MQLSLLILADPSRQVFARGGLVQCLDCSKYPNCEVTEPFLSVSFVFTFAPVCPKYRTEDRRRWRTTHLDKQLVRVVQLLLFKAF